ncbi:tRNA-uridine aminocarboxypropyltransferase 1 isoform X2 [Rhipicephalus microplus]|uniref:tRNA-uridine aminocarboxypropyltransferase 1 isoform X2 n=1 Tax=Rhipicephalus microplus TaxID=6941 RepID=UPI003F6C2672
MTRQWRPLITRSCLFEHEDPFSRLHISSSKFLEDITERGVCPECHKSRMYFCYTCLTALTSIRDKIPRIQVLLIFPGENAKPLEKMWEMSVQNGYTTGPCVVCAQKHVTIPWKTLLFIDSTWKQTKRIYLDAKIKGLPCAVLEGGQSAFWRPQRGKPSSWLATAEAVHLAVTRLLALQGCAGHVDDLLFFFKFFYAKISMRYRQMVSFNITAESNVEDLLGRKTWITSHQHFWTWTTFCLALRFQANCLQDAATYRLMQKNKWCSTGGFGIAQS